MMSNLVIIKKWGSMGTMLFTVAVFTVVLVNPLFSQSEYSAEYHCENGGYLGSKTGPFPHVEMDMPYDVMACYIAADSLCKLYDEIEMESIAAELSDDSIETAFKSLIAAQNYNPQLYRHLLFHTGSFKIPGYKACYSSIMKIIEDNYYSRIHERTFYDSLREKGTGGIYYVKVINQEHFIDSSGSIPGFKHFDRYCADLEIITAIYGYGTPWLCSIGASESLVPCQKVAWSRIDTPLDPLTGDSTKYYGAGPGLLVPGEEYIVVIINWCARTGGYNTLRFQNYPAAVFHVVNDVVYDPKHYFNKGDYIDKYQLINELHEKVNHY